MLAREVINQKWKKIILAVKTQLEYFKLRQVVNHPAVLLANNSHNARGKQMTDTFPSLWF